MIANYHTHTWRCNHAKGTEEEYVCCAIDRGLRILGFSDHSPYIFPGEYYSHFRMRMDQLPGYVQTVLFLKEKYAHRIELRVGVELEYYPGSFQQVLPALQDNGIEYMILGQHFIGEEIGEPYSGLPTADESVLKRYCAQAMDAMQTGKFTYFAHPDLIHFKGSRRTYEHYIRRMLQMARACDVPLEINLLGLREGRHYPASHFWMLAGEEGCKAVLGCDAHSPNAIKPSQAEESARSMAEKYGIEILQTVPLRKI